MPERNTPRKTLESWKQIAAYLERSERTVRRWEATEGLPVHRREHEKQDTVFAFRHEIEAWSRLRTKSPTEISVDEAGNLLPVKPITNAYLLEHDAITHTMHRYIHVQLIAGFEPRHHLLDVVDIHQVGAVNSPEGCGFEQPRWIPPNRKTKSAESVALSEIHISEARCGTPGT
jgi:hypothetical protein